MHLKTLVYSGNGNSHIFYFDCDGDQKYLISINLCEIEFKTHLKCFITWRSLLLPKIRIDYSTINNNLNVGLTEKTDIIIVHTCEQKIQFYRFVHYTKWITSSAHTGLLTFPSMPVTIYNSRTYKKTCIMSNGYYRLSYKCGFYFQEVC